LRESNLGKTNPCVTLHYLLAICFAPSLANSFIFLTLTRLVVVFIFVNFSFALFTPPLGDYHRGDDKKGKRREKKRYYKKKGGDAHYCREWDFDESSTGSSSDEDAANIAVTKGLLFPNVGHKCLMAKDDKKKKVKSRSSTKYATSSDEANSSDDEDDLLTLFSNLNMQQKEKLNELINAIHEKDELLDSQEDFLIKENKKHVKTKNAYALEVEKCEKLTSELSTCHDTISNLRNEHTRLIAKV
jgi:hypothetical protein